jgi:predicted transcriptional regulator
MNTPIEYQTIKDEAGNPAFVVIPYAEFLRLREQAEQLVPHEVVELVIMEKMTPIRAWREYLGLTQTEAASRMAISQSAFAQMEAPEAKVRKSTLRKIAGAFGIHVEQLDF